MAEKNSDGAYPIRVRVEPGVCGLACIIEGSKLDKYRARIQGQGSECPQIRKLFEGVREIGLKDLFAPPSRNPVFRAAEESGCHPMCPVPVAVLKTAEAVLGLALPRDVAVIFEPSE